MINNDIEQDFSASNGTGNDDFFLNSNWLPLPNPSHETARFWRKRKNKYRAKEQFKVNKSNRHNERQLTAASSSFSFLYLFIIFFYPVHSQIASIFYFIDNKFTLLFYLVVYNF